MTILGHILLAVGLLAALASEVRLLAAAFKCGLGWFFGCLFVPLADIVFLALNFRLTAKPFGIVLLGLVVAGLGDYLTGNVWFS